MSVALWTLLWLPWLLWLRCVYERYVSSQEHVGRMRAEMVSAPYPLTQEPNGLVFVIALPSARTHAHAHTHTHTHTHTSCGPLVVGWRKPTQRLDRHSLSLRGYAAAACARPNGLRHAVRCLPRSADVCIYVTVCARPQADLREAHDTAQVVYTNLTALGVDPESLMVTGVARRSLAQPSPGPMATGVARAA